VSAGARTGRCGGGRRCGLGPLSRAAASARAETHRELVFALHLGLMPGALERLAVQMYAHALIPFADPQRRIAQLRTPDHASGRTRRKQTSP
jgi:hypothetical protein